MTSSLNINLIHKPLLVIGFVFGIASPLWYCFFGYGLFPILTWVSSVILLALGLRKDKANRPINLQKYDCLAVLVLIVLFIPLYLVDLYTIPWQLNTDEVHIMKTMRHYGDLNWPDVFSLSRYFDFPAAAFIVFGKLANFFDSVNLYSIRSLHAISGLFIILGGYCFFRALKLSCFAAFCSAILLGSNHALLAISRMAMRDNTALLIEVMSLTLLCLGLFRKSFSLSVLGGFIAGLSFYSYYPGRMIICIWLGYLLILIFLFAKEKKLILQLGAITLLGFFISIAPLLVSTAKNTNDSTQYQQQQILIFPEGRLLQQQWSNTKTPSDAVIKNILKGLATFNYPLYDYGYIYPNHNNGFVDPASGIFLWIGIAFTVIHLFRKKQLWQSNLLVLFGFFSIYLILAFLISKAPQYTRLLIILPFFSYLSFQGIEAVLSTNRLHLTCRMTQFLSLTAVMGIAFWNLVIFNDFVRIGETQGNDVGSTARYIESKAIQQNTIFFLIANQNYPFYDLGTEPQWKNWLGFFISDTQASYILEPKNFLTRLPSAPFILLMNEHLWALNKAQLYQRYSDINIHNIKKNGSLVAIEINQVKTKHSQATIQKLSK